MPKAKTAGTTRDKGDKRCTFLIEDPEYIKLRLLSHQYGESMAKVIARLVRDAPLDPSYLQVEPEILEMIKNLGARSEQSLESLMGPTGKLLSNMIVGPQKAAAVEIHEALIGVRQAPVTDHERARFLIPGKVGKPELPTSEQAEFNAAVEQIKSGMAETIQTDTHDGSLMDLMKDLSSAGDEE